MYRLAIIDQPEVCQLKWIITVIENLMKSKFTGNLRINFSEGGISNVNKNESMIPPKEESNKK